MKQSLISIALCTYNGEKYLAQQLDSIIAQTYKDLEIIIVDDCSTDATVSIIKRYTEADDRIKFYKNEHNLGYNKNFERAISLTTGDYISISDQDDIWELNKIEVLFENIGNNWLVFSNSKFIDESGKESNDVLNNFSVKGKDYRIILFNNYAAGHAMLFKREFMDKFLPFPEKGFYDWWMAFMALYHHKIAYVDQVLTKYRKHSASVMQILKSDKEKLKYVEVQGNVDQLTAFETYSELKSEDREFISSLKNAFQLRLKYPYSIPMVKIIFKNYDILFSESKPRRGISRLNFAMKNSRKVTSGD